MEIEKKEISKDGSTKFLLKLFDGLSIEAVVLFDGKGRKTLCISTQVGCKMGCKFCRTASLGFSRNLTVGEILQQFMIAEAEVGRISNIVYMGMGEPLDNFEAMIQSLDILIDEKGFNLGKRKITISTCGLSDKILKLGHENSGVRLAISLNSAISANRLSIMPIEKKFNLDSLKESLLEYQKNCGGKRITLEYVMLDGENMSTADALAISEFANGLKVLINLIPLNGSPDIPYKVPSNKSCEQFERKISQFGLNVTRRYSKGSEISGACGQLAAKNISKAESNL